ncbi:hypothetical protein DKG34_22195 [Streptomyces sp. NWU49]|nr:hypothetical protein DKG34_22195 [Streptomyces sp. NWU49]
MGDGTTGGPRPVGPALDRPGPRPGRRYAEPVGGPLDGLLLEVTGFTPDEVDTDAAQVPSTAHCSFTAYA